jgi:hypothetical protein
VRGHAAVPDDGPTGVHGGVHRPCRALLDHLMGRCPNGVPWHPSPSLSFVVWMSFRPSPYYSARFYYWAGEIIWGDQQALINPLHWDRVVLNLPSSRNFDLLRPRVAKWNDLWDGIAGDVLAFVDNLRTSGPDEETACQIARLVAAGLQRLGIQDAPRKRWPPMRTTGAWASALFSTIDEKYPNQ